MAEISLKQLQDFHNIDRQAYARLVLGLGFDPFVSMKIVAFWNLLETTCFKHFVKNLQQLPDSSLSSLAEEALTCLENLYSSSPQQALQWVGIDFPETRKLVGQEISLGHVFKNREGAKRMIHGFVKDVCLVAFFDIVVKHFASKQPSSMEERVMREGDDDDDDKTRGVCPAGDRTLFITFSRGYPVSNQELHGFILKRFGKCVERIYMDDQNPPSLFACVVLNSLSDMSRILGGQKLVNFLINGKQVRARRYVPTKAKHSQKLVSFC